MPSPAPPCARSTGTLPLLLAFSPRPQTLLLVEDSRFAAESVRLICRLTHIRLRRAETLAEARRHLQSYRPELALVDLGLPDGSGLSLIAELVRLEPRRPRIVAVSGDAERRADALAAGADIFRAKPLGLAGHLEALLGLSVEHAQSLLARHRLLPDDGRDATAGADAGIGADTGLDPLALHDDLRRAHALLHAGGEVGYAGQFVGGIARSLDDAPLTAAADLAHRQGRRHPLMAALAVRVAAGPAI
jgi:CheY-like chemotaxis protein